MFSKTQAFYDAMYSFKDYEAESKRVQELIFDRMPTASTLLDVACGTGKHLEYLGVTFEAEGLELDPELAVIAKTRSRHVHIADMRDFHLGRTFDAVVCLFSSIGYALTIEGLNSTVKCFAEHSVPGGVIVVEPWLNPDKYRSGLVHSLHYETDALKITRMNTTARHGNLSVMDMHYLVGTGERIDYFKETHELMMFSDAEYRSAFALAGLEVEYDVEGLTGRGLYIGRKA